MKKLANLKGAKTLNNKEQKGIKGGITFTPPLPSGDQDCACIQWSIPFFQFERPRLEIVSVDCNSTCPDGSTPVSGLGH